MTSIAPVALIARSSSLPDPAYVAASAAVMLLLPNQREMLNVTVLAVRIQRVLLDAT
ncbi:hypothetical protein BAUCODRAFT_39809, partial [Baudoinia panamericana UAMH 10762]